MAAHRLRFLVLKSMPLHRLYVMKIFFTGRFFPIGPNISLHTCSPAHVHMFIVIRCPPSRICQGMADIGSVIRTSAPIGSRTNTSRTCGDDNFGRLLGSASIMIEALTEGSVMSLHRFLGPIARISLAPFAHRFVLAPRSGWTEPTQPLTLSC